MKLLKPEERKSLVEEICGRFHKNGLSELEIVGHFEKYTPLFHFRIAEPNDEDFIFITDLFGDVDIKPGLMQRGVRMQYHGNYNGLSKMIVQGIHDTMIAPYKVKNDKRKRIMINPSFRLESEGRGITDKNREKFDNALKYINHVLELTVPETRRIDVNSETFSSTYYVI